MEQKLKDKIEEIANEQGWSVSFHNNSTALTDIEFECHSSLGQDYCFTIPAIDNDPVEIINELEDYCDSYDFEEEAARWIGDDGHGMNGAPYRIADILKSTKEIVVKLCKLQHAIEKSSVLLRNAARHKMKVEITETLQRTVEVDAYNEDDAIELVEDMINREEVILDYNDYVKRDIEVCDI